MNEPRYFVWAKGVGNKPCPQKWFSDPTTGEDKKKDNDVFEKHLLNDFDAALPIQDLVKKYPAPDTTHDLIGYVIIESKNDELG